jgi:hypothetical protein
LRRRRDNLTSNTIRLIMRPSLAAMPLTNTFALLRQRRRLNAEWPLRVDSVDKPPKRPPPRTELGVEYASLANGVLIGKANKLNGEQPTIYTRSPVKISRGASATAPNRIAPEIGVFQHNRSIPVTAS